MNDRSRWSDPYNRQQQQGQNWSGQQGGWHETADRGAWDGNEWRGTNDWGDARPQANQWQDRPFRESPGTDRGDYRRTADRGQRVSHWSGPNEANEDRPARRLPATPNDYGEGFQRDDSYRPGSQSLAAGYGMRDGPDYDQYGDRSGRWTAAGASRPTFGRGYGPDYVGASEPGRDRGLIDRVTDTIAGWFGEDRDDDGDRAGREGARWGDSHRGRGPADYVRSDERIREDANDRLTEDHRLDARRISVRVAKGEVTLEGSVPNRASKRRAEDLVEAISGVKHVQNNLRIDALGDSAQTTGETRIGTAGAGSAATDRTG